LSVEQLESRTTPSQLLASAPAPPKETEALLFAGLDGRATTLTELSRNNNAELEDKIRAIDAQVKTWDAQSQKTEGLMAEITALGGDNVDGRGSAPHTVVVRPGSSHSIQEAIDRVADGGTVILSAGVYQQTITISGKHLRILGAGATGAQR